MNLSGLLRDRRTLFIVAGIGVAAGGLVLLRRRGGGSGSVVSPVGLPPTEPAVILPAMASTFETGLYGMVQPQIEFLQRQGEVLGGAADTLGLRIQSIEDIIARLGTPQSPTSPTQPTNSAYVGAQYRGGTRIQAGRAGVGIPIEVIAQKMLSSNTYHNPYNVRVMVEAFRRANPWARDHNFVGGSASIVIPTVPGLNAPGVIPAELRPYGMQAVPRGTGDPLGG